MSDLQFDCPNCGEHLSVDDEYGGAEIECPSCAETMIVPEPEPLMVKPIREPDPRRRPPPKASRGFPVAAVVALVVITGLVTLGIVAINSKKAEELNRQTVQYRTSLASVTQAIAKESAQCAEACLLIANEWERFNTHAAGRTQIVSLEDRLANIIKKHSDSLTSYKSGIDADAHDLTPPSPSFASIHKRFESYYDAYEQLYQAALATSGTRDEYVKNVKLLQATLDTLEAELNAFHSQAAP